MLTQQCIADQPLLFRKKISPHWPNFRNSEIRSDRIGLTSWIVNITSYNSFEIWPIMRTLNFGRTNDIPGIRQIPSQLFCHVTWNLALDADSNVKKKKILQSLWGLWNVKYQLIRKHRVMLSHIYEGPE